MRFWTTHRILREIIAMLSISMLILALIAYKPNSFVQAFFPSNARAFLLSPGSQTHQSITEAAITKIDTDLFPIVPKLGSLTDPMKKAIDEIQLANQAVDDDQKTAFKHFDGESFPEGQALVINRFNKVLDALRFQRDVHKARVALGEALHAIQDFYAHSNWVELGNTKINPDLGVPQHNIDRLPQTTPTCVPCKPCPLCTDGCATINGFCKNNLVTKQLTSGYYGGEDPPFDFLPAGKCNHGGALDSYGHGGISKDAATCGYAPHSDFHKAAADLALQASIQFLKQIQDQATADEMGMLLNGSIVVIIIDTTGGMGAILNSVKQAAIQLVSSRLNTDEQPSAYILMPFNDPGVGPITITTDATVFENNISALTANGGGDCPELSMSGIFQALTASDIGSSVFMFTDANAKDSNLAGAVSSLAAHRGTKVFPIIFGTCFQPDPAYTQVAQASGGQVFQLLPSEASKIVQLVDAIDRSTTVDLMSVSGTVAASAATSKIGTKTTGVTYTVPVDSTMRRVTFSVSGTKSVTLQRPDGTTVQPSDAGVNFLSLSSGAMYSIANPSIGQWSITIGGSGNFSIKAFGESTLDFFSFRFEEPNNPPNHPGFIPLAGFPIAGSSITVEASLSGGLSTAQLELRDTNGTVLQTFELTKDLHDSFSEFFGDITLPTTPFLTYFTGLDSNGKAYQRLLPTLIKPQTVRITAPARQDLRPGQIATYVFQVQNFGPSSTFQFSGIDNKGFLQGISPSTFNLATNQAMNVQVQLEPPLTIVSDTSDTLIVTVQSSSGNAANFAVVRSDVTVNKPPDISKAQPSIATLWPADHKLIPVSIVGVTEPEGEPFSIIIGKVMQNEPTNGTGDGDTCPDAVGIGTSTVQLRAERSGNGTGRVYTIFFTATDSAGLSSQGNVKVCVPHDQGQGGNCTDDNPKYDSTVCQ